ncbi:MAG: sodium:solute symporter [Flavobacteriaceae bacterium]
MLNFFDYLIILIYFLILSFIGFYFSKRQKSIDDYFKGGGRIPSWAAGISIFGTALSPITFLAIPAKTYSTDWLYFIFNITIFLVAPIIIYLFIPFYRNLNITTAYEYLEKRFNVQIRLIGSICFIIYQIGRIGIVLFLPSLALNLIIGIDIYFCISIIGIISLVYTLIGGIEAVIWTDVMQVIILLGGVIISIFVIITSIDGGITKIIEIANLNGKFKTFDFSFSLNQPTIWVMLIGGIFTNITTYGTDQTIVQRYLVTKTKDDAKKSIWINAITSIPASFIFFFIGTALYVFFKLNPKELNENFISNDAIFPWYIITQLPEGISGLLIAAILAAAMSSLSSSMNSASSSYINDIHKRFFQKKIIKSLRTSRQSTFIIGLMGISFAFFLMSNDLKSLWDEFNKILGLIIGGLGGVFLLGVLTKKANSFGVLLGLIFSFVIQFFVVKYKVTHLLMYTATGVLSSFILGYFFSLFRFSKSK